MRIVIFDPCLADSGHYRYFNWHIAQLLDESGIEIIFADYAGYFKIWYKDLSLKKASFKIIKVSGSISPQTNKYGPMRKLIKIITYLPDRKWYKHVLKNIEYLKPDLIIITSEARGGEPALYINKIFTPVIIVLHTIKAVSCDAVRTRLIDFKLWRRFYIKECNKFISKINGILVLEEKLKNLLVNLGYNSVFRIPYLLFEDNIVNNTSKLSEEFLVSTIGGIYAGKNIEFIINCIESEQFIEFKYRVAGKATGNYGSYIKNRVENLASKSVTGHFKLLSTEDYIQEIEKAHFIALPYSNVRSDQASGVMFDAIRNYRPIIAPDIEPFASYVNNYNIGLLYKEGDKNSFIDTVNKAKKLGVKAFMNDLIKFHKEFKYENWRSKFLEYILSKSKEL